MRYAQQSFHVWKVINALILTAAATDLLDYIIYILLIFMLLLLIIIFGIICC